MEGAVCTVDETASFDAILLMDDSFEGWREERRRKGRFASVCGRCAMVH